MSKATELRILQNQRSIDASVNYQHRSGDSEGNGGSMLDRYEQTESAEEIYFEEQDESAREVFTRAFRLYLKKTLTGKERKFLKSMLSGKATPAAIGRALGVNWFEYLQSIQRKAFNNAEAFGRVVRLSGWSRAQEFSGTVFKRLEELKSGAELNEILPQNKKYKMFRQKAREYYSEHREKICQYQAKWRKKHPEVARQRLRESYIRHRAERQKHDSNYRAMHREEINEKARARRIVEREKINEKERAYYETHRGQVNAKAQKYRESHREEIKARARERYAKRKAAKALAELMSASQEPQENQAYTE